MAEPQGLNGLCDLQAQPDQLANVNLCPSFENPSQTAEASAGKKSEEPLAKEHDVCY